MKAIGRSGVLALLPCLAISLTVPTASADGPKYDGLRFQLAPGETQTLFASRQQGDDLPVFKVCLSSPRGHGAMLHLTESNRGVTYGSAEPMAPGTCLFASSGKLAISINTEPSPEQMETRQHAADRAKAWLEGRVATLRAKEDRTEAESTLLQGFESRLEETKDNNAPAGAQNLTKLQVEQAIAELEGKEELTREEERELSFMRSKLTRLSNETVHVTVTLMPG